MTKRELIDRIAAQNPSAKPGFLVDFTTQQLGDYLRQLESLRDPPARNAVGGGLPTATGGEGAGRHRAARCPDC